MAIYVEIDIHGSLDDLWQRTQTPQLHARWDLRFTDIEYLPRPDDAQPQRFLYTTRIGFGLAVRGEGETSGTTPDASGRRTSALKFWSDDPKSLIAEGAGYWQYIPCHDSIRFLTWYDYRARYGAAGRWFDRLIFRPLLGWATAWSFDRLRLWIEKGLDPGLTLRSTLVHGLARLSLAAAWLYAGIVLAQAEMPLAGWLAVGMGALLLILHGRWVTLIGLALTLAGCAGAALIPAWMADAGAIAGWGLVVCALSAIDLLVLGDVPSAGRCRRNRAGERT